MDPEVDGRPVSDRQWAALEKIAAAGYAHVVKSKPGRLAITRVTANALMDRGLIEVTGTTARLTESGDHALRGHRARTGRYPQ